MLGRCILLLVLLLACIADASLRGALMETPDSAPLIRNYVSDEIGTTAKVRCLLESPDGMLFAGADRLLYYDGVRWGQARSETMPEILSLCLQGDRVWAGGVNEIGYFERQVNGEYAYTNVTARLGGDFYGSVNALHWTGKNIVIVTERKIVLLPPDRAPPRIWELPNARRLRTFQLGGVIYVNQPLAEGGKSWVLRDETLEPDTTFVGPGGQLRHLVGLEGDRMILASGYSLYERELRSGVERRLDADEGMLRKGLLAGSTTYLNGMVYACSQLGGLFIVDMNGHILQVNRAHGLPSEQCTAVAASRKNGVWVSTDEGISFVYDFRKASTITSISAVRSVYGGEGDLLVGAQGATVRYTADSRTELALPRGATFARFGSDVYAVTAGRIYHADTRDYAFSEMAEAWGGAGGVMIGSRTDQRALLIMVPPGLSRLDLATGRRTDVEMVEKPYYFLQDRRGRLWVSTQAGSIVALDDQLQKGTVQMARRKRANLAVHGGEVIILFDEIGFSDGAGNRIAGTDGLLFSRGTEDVEGPAWICGRVDDMLRAGVIGQGPEGLRWLRKNVPGLKRLKNVTCLFRQGDNLWIAGDGGIIQVDTTKVGDPVLSLPPFADITVRNSSRGEVRVLGSAAMGFDLSHEENEITVRFKTSAWGLLEPPRYESRLLPLEKEWTQHQYGDVINRRNLPTGRYTLEVRAVHLGEVGPVTSLRVWRRPPWYLSYTGMTCMALLGCAAFYGAVRLRTRRVVARNRELEDRIRERTRELARANAAKSEFLAAMSHEIRNPMNGVIGITKILQEAKLGAREKYYLTTLHRCAEQLRTTVDDVLDFSKIEAGEITLHPDTFDIVEAVKSTISAVDLTGDKLELTSWAGPRPLVTGDQGKFCQILTNYFNNALKYGVPPKATIDVYVLVEGGKSCRVTVAVKNCGPDLPPAELATLFERFTRGEYARRRRIGGSGLGLSICKRYAEAMGGSVSAASSGGVTVFQVSVPFEIAAPRESQPGTALLTRRLHTRALAIEDEDYNRLVLGSILTKMGYHVDWACDGKSALQLVDQNGYDLVLTDWLLPDTDGGALTREILARCEEPKPPVFAVTAYSTKEKEEECLAAGMAGFIAKPITVEKLEAALQSWADSRGSQLSARMTVVETVTPISLEQLVRLGPVEKIVPEFVEKMRRDWNEIDRLLEDRDCLQAANSAHRLISAALLIAAGGATDQLRILENRLREGALEVDIEKVRIICREEIARACEAALAALERRRRLNEARPQK